MILLFVITMFVITNVHIPGHSRYLSIVCALRNSYVQPIGKRIVRPVGMISSLLSWQPQDSLRSNIKRCDYSVLVLVGWNFLIENKLDS